MDASITVKEVMEHRRAQSEVVLRYGQMLAMAIFNQQKHTDRARIIRDVFFLRLCLKVLWVKNVWNMGENYI